MITKKKVRNQILLVTLLTFLAVASIVSLFIFSVKAPYSPYAPPYASAYVFGDSFTINTTSLQFGFGSGRYILLDGTLKTSDAELSLTSSDGRLTFTPTISSTFDVSSPEDSDYRFQHSGVAVTSLGSDSYRVTVSKNIAAMLYFRMAASDVPVLPTLSTGSLWTYLFEGDIVGFIIALLAGAFTSLTVAVGVVSFIIFGALYLRTGSLMLLVIAWFLVGSFIIVLMPDASILAIAFIIFGVAGTLYKLFRPGKD